MAFINRATTYDKLLSIATTVVSIASMYVYPFSSLPAQSKTYFFEFHFGVLTTVACVTSSTIVHSMLQCECKIIPFMHSQQQQQRAGVSLEEKEGEFFRKREIFLSSASSDPTQGRKSYSSRYVDELSFPDTSFVFIFLFLYFYFCGTLQTFFNFHLIAT